MTRPNSGVLALEKVRTLQQEAYNYVKSKIMNREFKPGQFLQDAQLAAELSFSRTPVREALRLLEHEGLLISQARRGWKVYSLTLQDIKEIFNIKMVLETKIARWAAESNDEDRRNILKNLMGKMKQAMLSDDHESWRKADTELHSIILGMGRNERASRIIRDLNDQWYRVRIGLIAMQGRVERSNIEHEAIVERILAKDGEGAEKMMEEHLHNLRVELEHVLVNMVFPFLEGGV